MVAPVELQDGDVLQRGDEVSFDSGHTWRPTPLVGATVRRGVAQVRYRRPVQPEGPQSQTQFLPRQAAVSPTLESDVLRSIIAKEAEHVAVIEENNRGRDRAVDLGVELRVLRNNFASRFRDRLFIVGARVIDTGEGKYSARGAEVVSA